MPNDGRPPAFLFYPADFTSDGDVEAMTTEEVGAYMLLLCKAWREEPAGSIPNDDRALARWARLTPDRWAECKPAVLAAFKLGGDKRWHQKRLRAEFNKLMRARKERHESAVTAAQARWGKPKDSCVTHASGNAIAVPVQSLSSSSSSASPPTEGAAAPPKDPPEALKPESQNQTPKTRRPTWETATS